MTGARLVFFSFFLLPHYYATTYALSKYIYMHVLLPILIPFYPSLSLVHPVAPKHCIRTQKRQGSLLTAAAAERNGGGRMRKNESHHTTNPQTIRYFSLVTVRPLVHTKPPAVNWLLRCKTLLYSRERERKKTSLKDKSLCTQGLTLCVAIVFSFFFFYFSALFYFIS